MTEPWMMDDFWGMEKNYEARMQSSVLTSSHLAMYIESFARHPPDT